LEYICDSCHGACCRAYRLTITIYDFLDLVNLVGLEEATKGITFEAIPYNENYVLNKKLMLPFIFDDIENSDKQMYILCLKRVASELMPNVQQCYFFREEKREEPLINPNIPNHAEHPGSQYKGWCGAYSHRPSMCRTYPIGLNTETYQSILARREDQAAANTNKALSLCPKSNLSLEDFGLQDQNAYMNKMNDLLLSESRTQAHNQAVMKWNSQTKRPLKRVLNFFQNIQKTLILTKDQINASKNITMTPQVVQAAVQALDTSKKVQQIN
jgi:Fe-S-cluster containining protein